MVDTPRSWRSEQSIHHFNQQVLAALDEVSVFVDEDGEEDAVH